VDIHSKFPNLSNWAEKNETPWFQNGQVQLYGTKCLDVINGVNADGTMVQVWDCGINTTVSQQFGYTAFGDNQWVCKIYYNVA
jgi:hypothetical protein